MIGDDFCKKHQPTVRKAAEATAAKWKGVLDADDIEQELWLFIMESGSVQKYLEEHSTGEGVSGLKRKAESICSDERIQYDYFSGNFQYNPADVRSIVGRLESQQFVSWDEQIDYDVALKEFKAKHTEKYEAYVLYFLEKEHASTSGERSRKQRALDKLVEIMNRKRSQRETDRVEGLGTRKDENNAH